MNWRVPGSFGEMMFLLLGAWGCSTGNALGVIVGVALIVGSIWHWLERTQKHG